ncbi:hypothetical protein XENTR_v10005260 [Xenopus tropicalis]|nr:hypothetical protein XENTR_v10005260 [Xenopus tropicalis]
MNILYTAFCSADGKVQRPSAVQTIELPLPGEGECQSKADFEEDSMLCLNFLPFLFIQYKHSKRGMF